MNKDEGWLINDFVSHLVLTMGPAQPCSELNFLPGAVHKKHSHTNCEEIYYIISGHGLAGAGVDSRGHCRPVSLHTSW